MSEVEPRTLRPRSLGDLLREVAASLGQAGIEPAADEARRLVARASGLSPLVVATSPDHLLTPAEVEIVLRAAARRADHEPLSRIMGEREFYGRPFRLSPQTLDPRPDSETLIDAALELARGEGWINRPVRILDVGTGSGCLLLTLLAELPLASGVGTDISSDALATAADNARRLGLEQRTSFRQTRSLTGIEDTFDLVVSNPPYIPTRDIAALDAAVRIFDPHAALDGGPDGLDIYREIAARLPSVCASGWTVMEVGAGQSDDVLSILGGAPWQTHNQQPTRRWMDLGGHTRAVAIRAQ